MLIKVKKARFLLVFCLLASAGCAPSLPGGYSVSYADRGRAWLANPDRSLAHGALIDRLYHDDRYILLVTTAVSLDGVVEVPRPLDGNCKVAILIDVTQQRARQLRLADANRLAGNMVMVEDYNRGCLQGQPTS
ncbi:MAG: hypothetical protein EON59_00290 [Alphaproteobacteria bacterium]|nr:MAG: hypothetical protein EON59_00290 [Alphaproteobacteria bacterium]